jgi:hypothetical protein
LPLDQRLSSFLPKSRDDTSVIGEVENVDAPIEPERAVGAREVLIELICVGGLRAVGPTAVSWRMRAGVVGEALKNARLQQKWPFVRATVNWFS